MLTAIRFPVQVSAFTVRAKNSQFVPSVQESVSSPVGGVPDMVPAQVTGAAVEAPMLPDCGLVAEAVIERQRRRATGRQTLPALRRLMGEVPRLALLNLKQI